MKLIFTYDSLELKRMSGIVDSVAASDHIHVLTVDDQEQGRNLYDVAAKIEKETSGSGPCIIFIDQYLACADDGFEWLQRNAGIALIKFLRMMGVKHHIVFVTPFADDLLKLVRENPANVIITSKGVSCTKYLHEFLKKPLDELEVLAKEQFDEKPDLKPYLKIDLELPQNERHNWANWWGIYRLWSVHRAILEKEEKNKELSEKTKFEVHLSFLEKKLKNLKNQKALSLYGHQSELILNCLDPLSLSEQRFSLEGMLSGIEARKRTGVYIGQIGRAHV